MQRLLGFKGKDIFNMDSTDGTLMITSIGLSWLYRLRLVTNGIGVPDPKGLIEAYDLCSAIYSVELAVKVSRRATASLPILGSISVVNEITVRQKAVKVRSLFRATSVLVEKILHSFFRITGIPI